MESDENTSQSFDIVCGSDVYSFVLLPANHIQVTKINIISKEMFVTISSYHELNIVLRSEFSSCKKVFEAIKSTKSRRFQFQNQTPKVLRINFQHKGGLVSIDFQVNQRKKIQKDACHEQKMFNIQSCDKNIAEENKKLNDTIREKDDKIREVQISRGLIKIDLEVAQRKMKELQNILKQRGLHPRNQRQESPKYYSKPKKIVPNKNIINIEEKPIEVTKLQQKIESSKFSFAPYPNQFLENFVVVGQTIRIIHQHKHFYQVVSKSSVPQSGIFTVGLKILYSRLSTIYFGLTVRNRQIFQYTGQSRESVSYKLSGGKRFYEDGVRYENEVCSVQQGETLWISLNFDTMMTGWIIEGKSELNRKLPSIMHGKPLYVFVSMQDENDTVQIV